MADMGYYRRGVLGIILVVVGWEETARDKGVSDHTAGLNSSNAIYSHPSRHKQISCTEWVMYLKRGPIINSSSVTPPVLVKSWEETRGSISVNISVGS